MMMKLVFVVPALVSGGAERAVVLLAEGFSHQGYGVTIVTIYGKDRDFYDIPELVNRIALDVARKSPTVIHALLNNIYRVWVLRRTIQSLNPDVVISFLEVTNVLTLVALTGTGYPVLICEQNNPEMNRIGMFWKILRLLCYRWAKQVVSCSKGVDQFFNWLPSNKRTVIYNPLAVDRNHSEAIDIARIADPSKQWIVAMGRLTHQKGFDILLSAFHTLANKYSDWQLVILGEGELRSELENIRDRFGLAEKVCLPGSVKNPFPILKRSKFFVLSSRFEGFGNVLIEAMSCGLPVISTDCPSGPREIIHNNVDGILVQNEDINELAEAMERLMLDDQERQRLGNHAFHAVEKFSLKEIIEQWKILLKITIG